jgi:site-specific DNA-methyltransferase (adenine-specific)
LLQQLEDNSVDAVITDPPYCSGGQTANARAQTPSSKYEQSDNKIVHRPDFVGDTMDQRSWLHWCTMWINDCQRILKPEGYFLMFTDWRQMPTASDALQMGGLIWCGIVSWNKGLGARAPHKGYFRHQCEYIVWGTNGKCSHAKHAGPYPGCFDFPVRQKDKFHLTGKPTPLMEELVQIVPEDSVILDPFAGSGTTCIAAKKHNRRYIGFEKTEVYYDIAEKRIKDIERK